MRGYRAVDKECVAIDVPEHAHLDYTGRAWDCDPPYRRELEACALPQ